jgi:hypothetical protein
MNQIKLKRAVIAIILMTLMTNTLTSQNSFFWGRQFGTDKDEYAMNYVTDNNGHIYVAGKTTGIADGKNYGKNDGFLIKIDSMGNIVWSRQFGTQGEEDVLWSAIDNTGCVYITGSTTGALSGKNSGLEDIFVVKYDPDGRMEWSKQFGSDSTDAGNGVWADGDGYIYLTGQTRGKLGESSFGKTDFYIMKLDTKGNKVYIRQFGTAGDDNGYAITGGPGSEVFICGTTWGDFSGKNKGFFDGFTGQFSKNGDLIRYNQFGTDGFDIAMILRVDNEKNIYVGGSTSGNFGRVQIGEGDGFLMKMNEKGDFLWNRQFGTEKHDGVRSIDFNRDDPDFILVSGLFNLPPAEAFIQMYRRDGTMIWERKFRATGKSGDTSGKCVSFDGRGNFYHMGLTGANMFGPLIGEHDVYVVKIGLDTDY